MPENCAPTPDLTQDFIDNAQRRIAERAFDLAAEYFRDGNTAYSVQSGAKRVEMAQNFFDYQPCCVSILARLGAEGHDRARVLVARIFENAQYFLDEWRAREGYTFCLRRAQLHLAIAYERLHAHTPEDAALRWRALLLRSTTDILDHFNGFQERVPALDNRAFGTGINHVALAAESVWRTGRALDRPELCETAGSFLDRLSAYGHPDGYFEEHTNDAREGGPSLVYTGLCAGAAFLVNKWRGTLDRARFEKCGDLFRNLVDAHGNCLAFADERANPTQPNPFGLAVHSLTPEGRGFLGRLLGGDASIIESANCHNLGRLALELENCETGPAEAPEGEREGTFRLTLPLGVVRRRAWTAGLSALRALNREISPNGDYALDRQSLLYLSHARAGVILRGIKSKKSPDWSTVRAGDDAWPARTGNLSISDDTLSGCVHYESFDAEVSWHVAENAAVTVRSGSGPFTVQLVPELVPGDAVSLDGQRRVLGDDEFVQENVSKLETDAWALSSNVPGSFVWYIAPFNPYAEANRSAPGSRRPAFRIEVPESVTATFSVLI